MFFLGNIIHFYAIYTKGRILLYLMTINWVIWREQAAGTLIELTSVWL